MKKILILMIAVMAMGVQTVSAQYAKIMLQHNGKATLFDYTEVQKAIDASVDGDTIYIGEGPYNNSAISITKKITIMGQGEKSQLGDITINLPGGSEMTSTILYGVKAGSVTINSSMTNLHIDKCTMGSLTILPQSTISTKTYVMKDMVIERCYISNSSYFRVSDEYDNCIVRNCEFNSNSNYYVYVNSNNISFINCKIFQHRVTGNFINCIISSFYDIRTSATYTNCQLGSTPSYGTTTNCFIDSKTTYTDEELQVKGYFGTDGTIVGPNGGARPFNLVPAVPSLEDIKLDVNYNTKKLNVTVKVKAN